MAHVTPQRSNFISFLEVLHANDTVVDTPELASVPLDLWHVVDDACAKSFLSIALLNQRIDLEDYAGAEQDEEEGEEHGQESQW